MCVRACKKNDRAPALCMTKQSWRVIYALPLTTMKLKVEKKQTGTEQKAASMTEWFSAHLSRPGAHGQLDRQSKKQRKRKQGETGTEGLIHCHG